MGEWRAIDVRVGVEGSCAARLVGGGKCIVSGGAVGEYLCEKLSPLYSSSQGELRRGLAGERLASSVV